MRTNAKTELERFLDGRPTILCASIKAYDNYDFDDNLRYAFNADLPISHTEQEFKAFMDKLSTLNYDSGYGGQELFGTIWFEDGTWADRGEYDGSEWWNYNRCPAIPKHLIIPK